MAIAIRAGDEAFQVQMVCLDELVPVDDELRRIERLVNWGAVRSSAEPFYVSGGPGRPAVDPVVLVKLAVVLAWRGAGSMRQVLADRQDGSVGPAVSRVRAHRDVAASLDVQSCAVPAVRGFLGV